MRPERGQASRRTATTRATRFAEGFLVVRPMCARIDVSVDGRDEVHLPASFGAGPPCHG
ncbi:MAG: hypothetical protein ACE14W_08290 [Candidatus Velamenicoccus archaeovorus]